MKTYHALSMNEQIDLQQEVERLRSMLDNAQIPSHFMLVPITAVVNARSAMEGCMIWGDIWGDRFSPNLRTVIESARDEIDQALMAHSQGKSE